MNGKYYGPFITRKQARDLGSEFYLMPNPCCHGHNLRRKTSTGACIQCNRDRTQKWVRDNPDKFANAKKRYRKSEKGKATERAYRQSNKEKIRAYVRVRRAAIAGSEGFFSKKDIDDIYTEQNGKCAWCKCKLEEYEIDHIMPVKLGGSNWPHNIQLMCMPCNRKKGSMHPAMWKMTYGEVY